jgi:hypothetical protein
MRTREDLLGLTIWLVLQMLPSHHIANFLVGSPDDPA